jgi:hypothetical protein
MHVRRHLLPHLGAGTGGRTDPGPGASDVTSLIRTHAAAGRPLSPATLQRVHATLRAALNGAVRRGLLVSNPARVVELPSGQKPHPVVWTPTRIALWQASGIRPAVAVWNRPTNRRVPRLAPPPRASPVRIVPPRRAARAAPRRSGRAAVGRRRLPGENGDRGPPSPPDRQAPGTDSAEERLEQPGDRSGPRNSHAAAGRANRVAGHPPRHERTGRVPLPRPPRHAANGCGSSCRVAGDRARPV